jgi:hypothetical protein
MNKMLPAISRAPATIANTVFTAVTSQLLVAAFVPENIGSVSGWDKTTIWAGLISARPAKLFVGCRLLVAG